jgi:hypothetical protein
MLDPCVKQILQQRENEVRRMLECWVSGLDPALAYQNGNLIGLTIANLPLGVKAPIVVRND